MFILIDTDLQSFIKYYDHINELDDKPVLAVSDLDDLTAYSPEGSFHIVDLLSEFKEMSRWDQLVLAKLGGRVWTDKLDKNSPVYAGPVPVDSDKIRKISVDGFNAETRAGHFAKFGVNYIGRTKVDPKCIFVLDNKKDNPLQDPSKDPRLETLYAALPEDWWGSVGFVSTSTTKKLEKFFDDQPMAVPIAWTSRSVTKLKALGLDFALIDAPSTDPDYGILVRDKANLILDPPQTQLPQAGGEPLDGFKWVI